jgi:hypothetical protein
VVRCFLLALYSFGCSPRCRCSSGEEIPMRCAIQPSLPVLGREWCARFDPLGETNPSIARKRKTSALKRHKTRAVHARDKHLFSESPFVQMGDDPFGNAPSRVPRPAAHLRGFQTGRYRGWPVPRPPPVAFTSTALSMRWFTPGALQLFNSSFQVGRDARRRHCKEASVGRDWWSSESVWNGIARMDLGACFAERRDVARTRAQFVGGQRHSPHGCPCYGAKTLDEIPDLGAFRTEGGDVCRHACGLHGSALGGRIGWIEWAAGQ